MSRYSYITHHGRPQIVVNDNDILSGRGVNIAHHAGNQRFRTLVTTRADESYCATYSASEKRAVAEEIIKHVKSLDPPGRFLKRDGRGQVSRGLSGPWEELSEREAIKKACQALRDCNRLDRQGYAAGVSVPTDVQQSARSRHESGLTGKQQAARSAAEYAAAQAAATIPSSKRDWGRVSPSVENAAEWLKKQRTDEMSAATATTATPSTSGSDAMNGSNAPIQYDPAAVGMPPYEPIRPPPHYAQAPALTYQPTAAGISPNSYALVAPAPSSFAPSPAPHVYALTPAFAPGQGAFQQTQSGHAQAPPIGYQSVAAPVNVTLGALAPAPGPYVTTAGQAAAAATADLTPPWAHPANPSPVYAHAPAGVAPLTMPVPTYAPAPAHTYAPIAASSPYAPSNTAPGPAPTNGNMHYQHHGAPVYHQAPVPYQQHPAPSANGGYHHVQAPIAYTAVSPSPTTYQASSNQLQGSYQHASAPAPIAYQQHHPSQSAPLPSYPQAPTVEADLSPTPAPIAPAGTEAAYGTTHYETTSRSFPAPLQDSAYDHGDILAPSAGADLLISAAYQSELPSAIEAQALVDAAVVAAAKWEGEALGL